MSINDTSVMEGNSGMKTATFTVTLSAASTDSVTVQYVTTDGTAMTSEDYDAVPLTTLTFNPGQVTKTIDVKVRGDKAAEGNETFFVSLSNPTNATLADAQGEVTIIDDDAGPEAMGVTIVKYGKAATFTDVDGDKVTVKTSKSTFTQGLFDVREEGLGFQLQSLNLTDAGFSGAKLSFGAKPQKLDEFDGKQGAKSVNVGEIDAFGVSLKAVQVKGDLGRIGAGAGGSAIVRGDGGSGAQALGTLSVSSFGALGLATQDADGISLSTLSGSLKKLSVKGDMVAGLEIIGGGSLGKATIKGDLDGSAPATSGIVANGFGLGDQLGFIRASGDIGSVKVGGNVIGGADTTGIISGGNIKSLKIGEDLRSANPVRPALISALGEIGAAKQKDAVAIAKVSVGGSVENARILASYDIFGFPVTGSNGDASINKITVKGDVTSADIVAGVSDATRDGFGHNDTLIDGGGSADLIARIAKVTIKGQASGSTINTTDHFAITGQEIGSVKIGKTKIDTDGTADLLLDDTNNDLRLVEIAG
ncbi:MAG: Calx-beta domain-containing protein [Chthoniobacteraceae bacterium]